MPRQVRASNSGAQGSGLFGTEPLLGHEAVRAALLLQTVRQRRHTRSEARERADHLGERERNGNTSPLDRRLLREALYAIKALERMEVATSRGNAPSEVGKRLDEISTELAALQATPKSSRSAESRQRIQRLRAEKQRVAAELRAETDDGPGPGQVRQYAARATRVRSVVGGGLPGLGQRR